MTKKNCIIITIGNRDLQIGEEKIKDFKYRQYFSNNNNDDERFYVIDKEDKYRDVSKKFIEISKLLYDEYENLKNDFSYPIIECFLREIVQSNSMSEFHVILCATHQKNPHSQDTYYVGKIIEKWLLGKNLSVELKEIEADPREMISLNNFFYPLYEEVSKKYEAIHIENSGGTPMMRASSICCALFKDRFNFYEIIDGKIDSKNYEEQEKLILRDKVKSMLETYDFSGILKLGITKEIDEKCKEAIKTYNFEETSKLDKKEKIEDRYKNKIDLLFENLKVCVKQHRWTEVISRFFRIEETIGGLLLLQICLEKDLINSEEKVLRKDSNNCKKYDPKFEDLLIHKCNKEKNLKEKFFEFHFEKLLPDKNILNYLNSGKNFFYFFFTSLDKNKYSKIYSFFEKLNLHENEDYTKYGKNGKLTKLRNRSIAGHGTEPISKEIIEKELGSLNDLISELGSILENELHIQNSNYFDNQKKKIEKLLEA